MHTTDLYTADFPHGTPAGYEQGCRGGACPNRGSAEEQTCKEAHTRYQRDPDYKRLVKSGAPLEQLAAKEGGVTATPAVPLARPKPQIYPPLSDTHANRAPRPPAAETQHIDPAAAAPVPIEEEARFETFEKPRRGRKALSLDHPDFPHGTTRGANRGCKDAMDCPGDPVTGLTCVEARRQYNRDYAKNHTKTSPGEGSAPTPNVPAEQNQARETGGTTPAESEATIRTPEPSTVDHTPPTPDEPRHDPTHGRIDRDIQDAAAAMKPHSVSQLVAIENSMQHIRDYRGPVAPEEATPPTGGIALVDAHGEIRAHVEQQILDERQRQIEHGYTAEHDDEHGPDRLLLLAFEYLTSNDLVKTGALLLALRELLGRQATAHANTVEASIERIKQLKTQIEDSEADFSEMSSMRDRTLHDYQQLWLAHEKLRNDRTIDTQLGKLVPALAGELEPTGGEGAAQADVPASAMLLQPEAAGGIRVALRGNTQPMRFHVSFEDGQASTVSVSLGGE